MPVMFNTILIQEGIDPVQVRLLRLRKRRKGLLFVVPTPSEREGIAGALEKDTSCKNCEDYEAHRRIPAAEGDQARNQAGPWALGKKSPAEAGPKSLSKCLASLL